MEPVSPSAHATTSPLTHTRSSYVEIFLEIFSLLKGNRKATLQCAPNSTGWTLVVFFKKKEISVLTGRVSSRRWCSRRASAAAQHSGDGWSRFLSPVTQTRRPRISRLCVFFPNSFRDALPGSSERIKKWSQINQFPLPPRFVAHQNGYFVCLFSHTLAGSVRLQMNDPPAH